MVQGIPSVLCSLASDTQHTSITSSNRVRLLTTTDRLPSSETRRPPSSRHVMHPSASEPLTWPTVHHHLSLHPIPSHPVLNLPHSTLLKNAAPRRLSRSSGPDTLISLHLLFVGPRRSRRDSSSHHSTKLRCALSPWTCSLDLTRSLSARLQSSFLLLPRAIHPAWRSALARPCTTPELLLFAFMSTLPTR